MEIVKQRGAAKREENLSGRQQREGANHSTLHAAPLERPPLLSLWFSHYYKKQHTKP